MENREIHFANQMAAWRNRSEAAEEKIKILLEERAMELKSLESKMERLNRKISHLTRLKLTPGKDETPSFEEGYAIPRRGHFKDSLVEHTRPDWDTEFDMVTDEWLVIRVPKGNRSYVKVDFVDGDTEDDKEWLEGPYHQRSTITDLLRMRDWGRRERRLDSRFARELKGARPKSKRKPSHPLESLARSIAPGGYPQDKRRSSSNAERVVRERELAPAENEEAYDYDDFFKGNEKLQKASVESFRRKVGKTNELDSPRISGDDLIESERKRLKRDRSPVLIMEDNHSKSSAPSHP
jgi:hypothetical protein